MNNLTGGSALNKPLGIILHGKDGGRTIRFSAASHADAQRVQEALNNYAFPGRRNLGYLFAFESRRGGRTWRRTRGTRGGWAGAATGRRWSS
jgi:hypothetical protein